MEALEDKIKRFLQDGDGSGFGYGDGSGYGSGSGSGFGYGDGSGDGDGDGYGDGSGYGYGYGYGDGYGDGDGYGYGYGYGDGYGYGSGSGSGFGYGDGYGDGDGDGSGDGYGDGYGDGSGDGYGDGIKSLNGECIHIIDGMPTIIRSIHSTYAVGVILNNDLTLTHTYIAKVGNCFAHGDTLRQARESAEAKALKKEPVEQRILRFKEQYPDNNKKIPAMELFKWHNILTGSCEQGRRNFALNKGIDLDNDSFTIQEFVEITKNSYGGDIIKQILL